jgi:hypothetical protein
VCYLCLACVFVRIIVSEGGRGMDLDNCAIDEWSQNIIFAHSLAHKIFRPHPIQYTSVGFQFQFCSSKLFTFSFTSRALRDLNLCLHLSPSTFNSTSTSASTTVLLNCEYFQSNHFAAKMTKPTPKDTPETPEQKPLN